MARTSRKKQQAVTVVAEVKEKVYKTALYLRLSILDSGVIGGESIINQRDLLEQYVANKSELSLKGIFADNGKTGRDYDRPAWNDLMIECKAGRINCIVVRDLSRLGRNYIETGELLEKILPMLGVRLISVNDNYDNLHLTLNEQLVTNLKNIVNDIYSKDIGRKVSTALRTKKENGEFMGTYAAYGYLKDPLDNHKLVPNHETAPIVEQIFKWKAEGVSHAGICRKLNEADIPSPNRYRLQKGILKDERYANCEWRVASVKAILHNPVYLGKLAQGKKVSVSSSRKLRKRIKPEDWIIVENTHKAIITQELYDQAYAVMHERTQKSIEYREKYKHVVNHTEILRGLVYCADCKRPMPRTRRNVTNKHGRHYIYYTYLCQTNDELGTCLRKHISEADLIAAVYAAVRHETKKSADIKHIVEKLSRKNWHKLRLARFDTEIEEATKEIKRICSLKQAIFEDYVAKLISRSEFQFATEKYNADMERENEKLRAAKSEKADYIANSTTKNKWLAAVSRFIDEKELTAPMAKTLVERVVVKEHTKVDVVFKFYDEYESVRKHSNYEDSCYADTIFVET